MAKGYEYEFYLASSITCIPEEFLPSLFSYSPVITNGEKLSVIPIPVSVRDMMHKSINKSCELDSEKKIYNGTCEADTGLSRDSGTGKYHTDLEHVNSTLLNDGIIPYSLINQQATFQNHNLALHNETNALYSTSSGKDLALSNKSIHRDMTCQNKKRFLCTICCKEFATNNSLKIHTRLHTGERPYKCIFCTKKFVSCGELQRHTRTHTKEKPYECIDCGKRYTGIGNLKIHRRTHTGEKPYKCKFCLKEFIRNRDLQNHLRKHEGLTMHGYRHEIEHNATSISLNSTNIPHLVTNQFEESESDSLGIRKETNSSLCASRNQSFVPSYNSIHLQKKSKGKRHFKCRVCGKEFSTNNSLKIHTRLHTGEKPYKCIYCTKQFVSCGELQRHTRSHTGEKPYECKDCGKRYISSGNLQIHRKTHTGEKPYTCMFCNKPFLRFADLQKHVRTHTGEKPYKCNVCGKEYSVSSTLIDHMEIHTRGDKRYKCPICNNEYATVRYLKKHMKKHNERQPTTDLKV